MDVRPQNAVLFATIVVVNIIWWMLMIAAIGLGASHLNQCPVQPFIPIYLIVLGANSIIALSVTYNCNNNKGNAIHILGLLCMTVLHIFSFVWLIAGTCWVYSVYPPSYSDKDRYCDKITYQFAFVITTLLWVTMSLVFICGCCIGLLTCCTTVFAGRHLLPNRNSFYGAIGHFQGSSAGDV